MPKIKIVRTKNGNFEVVEIICDCNDGNSQGSASPSFASKTIEIAAASYRGESVKKENTTPTQEVTLADKLYFYRGYTIIVDENSCVKVFLNGVEIPDFPPKSKIEFAIKFIDSKITPTTVNRETFFNPNTPKSNQKPPTP